MGDLNPTILLIEDNEDDIFILKRVLKKAGIMNPLQVVTDGQQALDYLKGVGKYADRGQYPIPFIAFIDLKLPYVSGFEILEWMQGQPDLNSVVAIVLTSSNQDKDNQRAYSLGARSYLVKPPTTTGILTLMDSLKSFWSRIYEDSPIQTQTETETL